MKSVQLYDTTLRDGAQQEGISFSVADKLKIARQLDTLGVQFIEGGWPGSNPKDVEFFKQVKSQTFQTATVVGFGSTRRPNAVAANDANLKALIKAQTRVVTLVGKSWDLHVTKVLETTLEENLRMIADSIRLLKSYNRTVFFDAEHFFDGYKCNRDYATQIVKTAAEAGADCFIMCDTNGGALPTEVSGVVRQVRALTTMALGMHAHNDGDLAVANTLAAVEKGATQVQGTINGLGERCGNANLCSIIPNLRLKAGIPCVTDEQLARITSVSRYISELANMKPSSQSPFVGLSAFTHKAGLHVSGMMKCEDSYQHIKPEAVGNSSRVLVSELSGMSNIVYKAREKGVQMPVAGESARAILDTIKQMESKGFQYDGAEASFELLVRRAQPDYKPPFELVDFMVVVERRRRLPTIGGSEEMLSEATVKVRVNGEIVHTAAEGNGPVNALDGALRKALVKFYPELSKIELTDYKVRILDESAGTGSLVRVLIESSDGNRQWRTVGSSTNIIEASWLALADALEYWLIKQKA